jgi:hypothetical protein
LIKQKVEQELKKLTSETIKISWSPKGGYMQVLVHNELYYIDVGDLTPDRVNSMVKIIKETFPELFL